MDIYNSRNFTGDLDGTGRDVTEISTTVEILQATLTARRECGLGIYNSRNFTGDLDDFGAASATGSTTVEILQATLTGIPR